MQSSNPNVSNIIIGKKFEYFLATGNLRSMTGMDLLQQKGFSIVADKINNMRYLSHFRSVHRGTYFVEMKTTSVRKLLPENWGFICPVHTPDGVLCGLLNHLTSSCIPLPKPTLSENYANLYDICLGLGMAPIADLQIVFPEENYLVLFDGKLIGYVEETRGNSFVENLRYLKIMQIPSKLIPAATEIGFFPKTGLSKNSVFPGIFIQTTMARLVRPVKNLRLNSIE